MVNAFVGMLFDRTDLTVEASSVERVQTTAPWNGKKLVITSAAGTVSSPGGQNLLQSLHDTTTIAKVSTYCFWKKIRWDRLLL